MNNEKNLIPFNQRSKSEARELGAKGGRASGESRRRRKALKDSMNALLELPPSDVNDFNQLSQMGIAVEDIDNSQMVVVGLFRAASAGDVQAFKELRNLIGEDRPETEDGEKEVAATLREFFGGVDD
ncbi:KGG domain-containing protein [Butyricicoccus sp.]|uniref:KGG domain-containing protein n=1 Tax=Butyricicoccus sp. TaxID=2049021 RepID=UPI003F171EC8